MTPWQSRNVLAFALAPVAPVVLFFIFFAIVGVWDGSGIPNDTGSFLGWVALVSYGGFVLFGLPTVLVLRHVGSLKLWTLLLSGAVFGTLMLSVFQLVLLWPYSSLSLGEIGYLALWGVPAGVSVAFAYWFISRGKSTQEKKGPGSD